MGFIFKGILAVIWLLVVAWQGDSISAGKKEPAVNIFWPVIHCCLPLQSCFPLP